MATYTHDYADRPKTLTVTPAEGAAQAIVTASAYRPFAPSILADARQRPPRDP